MKKLLLILLVFIVLTSTAFASSSASYHVSVEAIGAGGDAASTNHAVHGLKHGAAYDVRTSTNFRVGEGVLTANVTSLTLSPIISSISPSSGNKNGIVSVTINGANFLVSAEVHLKKTGQTDITGESITIVNSTQITCTFNLAGKITGGWDVLVQNVDGTSGILSGGFNITSYSGTVKVVGRPINFPNPFDPEKQSTTIKYELSKDAGITLNIFNINGTRIWQQTYASGTNGGKAGVNQVLWDGYSAFSNIASNGIYVYQIASGGNTLATGKIAVFR